MRPGDTVLVLGAAGGVGTAAIQVAQAMGAKKVLAVVHREAAADYVASLGADLVVPLADGWADRVRGYTHGRGVDAWSTPSAATPSMTRFASWRSTASCCDRLRRGQHPDRRGQPVAAAERQRGGRRAGRVPEQGPGSAALFSWGLSQLVFLGLRPPPPQRYPLSEGQAGLQSLAEGGVLGKLVLEP